MKFNLFVVLVLVWASSVSASERIKMSQEFSGEAEASDLLESVASAANSGDFKKFIGCFTAKYASAIRRKMKSPISNGDVEMEIIDRKVDSCDGKTIKMRVKYSWADSVQKRILTSDIVARLEEGSWKIASESVIESKNDTSPPLQLNFGGGGQVVFSPSEDVLPLDIPKIRGGCPGGRCGVPNSPLANQVPVANFNPMANVNQFNVLPLDMPRRRGGCAGGVCTIK